MHLGAYEVFSVISGVVLIIAALLPIGPAKERLWAFLGGVFFIAYGIFVASRTSGTWVFPIWIFVIPFAGVGYVIYRLVTLGSVSGRAGPPPGASAAPPARPPEAWTPARPPVAEPPRQLASQPNRAPFCSQCGTRAEPGERYCGACGAVLETI